MKNKEAVAMGKKSWLKRSKKLKSKAYMSKIGKSGRAKQLEANKTNHPY